MNNEQSIDDFLSDMMPPPKSLEHQFLDKLHSSVVFLNFSAYIKREIINFKMLSKQYSITNHDKSPITLIDYVEYLTSNYFLGNYFYTFHPLNKGDQVTSLDLVLEIIFRTVEHKITADIKKLVVL